MPLFLNSLQNLWRKVGDVISLLAVMGILAACILTCADVLLRWIAGSGVVALNEFVSLIVATSVAATLPAGIIRRVNLRVDLLRPAYGDKCNVSLDAIGSLVLIVAMVPLAYEVWAAGTKAIAQGRSTFILFIPVGPFLYAISACIWAAVGFQALNLIEDMGQIGKAGQKRTDPVARIALALLCLGFAILGAYSFWDFKELGAMSFAHPAISVLISFGFLWLALLAQVPVGAATALVGIWGAALMIGGAPAFEVYADEAIAFMTNPQVATLPMFLLMGAFAGISGISQDIYAIAHVAFGRFKGGLAYATIGGCAGFGAVTGSSVATATTFGAIALPEMEQRGYKPEFGAGVVAAGGTLGALIPPSAPLILFALLTEESIGRLFIGAMIPALLGIGLYFLTIKILMSRDKGLVTEQTEPEKFDLALLKRAIPATLLMGGMIGGLYSGLFTANEAAAVGAVGSVLITLLRGRLTRATFLGAMTESASMTAMIYGLIFGALVFSFYVGLAQVPDMATLWVASLQAPPLVILLGLVLVYLLLGTVMDSFAIMVITVPVVAPIVLDLGYDMVFWGILMLMVVETGMISPPFGLNLFVIKAMRPEIPYGKVIRGVLPFVTADIVKIVLVILIPAIATWLPAQMGG